MEIVKKFDRAVDVVVSGHTHQAYVCEIDGRLVTSGDKYGTLVTAIDLQLDVKTRDVISARANNVVVRSGTLAKDPEQTALLEAYDKFAAPIGNRQAGSIAETLSRMPNDAGESALGDIIADAQLAATTAAARWRRRDRVHQSGRHPHRHHEETGRCCDLRRRVRQPAIPQSTGHADAHGNPDQEPARAAVARSRNGR